MVDEIALRNSVHKGSFRFDVTPRLWTCLYDVSKEGQLPDVITVEQNGTLRGYAAYSVFVRGQLRTLSVLDITADGQDTLDQLIDCLVQLGRAEDVDLVYFRKSPDRDDPVFDRKGFLSFVESVIMVALFNPIELLKALSQDNVSGVNLQLKIEGFNPVTVTLGEGGIKVVSNESSGVKVYMDAGTFLKLLFGRTTLFKQLLRRKVKVSNVLRLMWVKRFFEMIKQEKWYIPFGDWT